MKFKKLFLPILFLAATTVFSQKPVDNALTTGPEKGSLVIVGGGRVVDTIMTKFIELAGGRDASFVVIPTAGGDENYGEDYYFAQRLKKFGAKNVTVLHTYDRAIADSDDFTASIQEANAVWFGGGRQWRLVDAYKDTKTEKTIWDLLNRGGVVGGSSAGATIQGSYLARGDTKNNQIMMGDHEEGFGYIKNIAIDQHVLARNRHFDMFSILKNRPELLGIGIDESTAIVVQGNTFDVIGEGKVLVYDGTFWSREGSELKNLPAEENLFYFLQEGDSYDLMERSVLQ